MIVVTVVPTLGRLKFGGSVSTARRRITSPYRNTSRSTGRSTSTTRSKRYIDSSTFPTIEATVSHDTCNSSSLSASASASASDKNAYEKNNYQFDVDQNGNSAAMPMSPMSPLLTPTPCQRGRDQKRFEVEEDDQQDQDQHPSVNVKSSINTMSSPANLLLPREKRETMLQQELKVW